MKTLNNYISESILDIEGNIEKGIKSVKKLVKDSYEILNVYISKGDGTQVELDKYLKINDIKKDCDELYKQYRDKKPYHIIDKTARELIYILGHTQLLSFDQNMLASMRSYLKNHFLVDVETYHRKDKIDLVYTICPEKDNKPIDEVDIHFVLKKV